MRAERLDAREVEVDGEDLLAVDRRLAPSTWPFGPATNDWPQNSMPSGFTGLPFGPATFSRPMRFGEHT